MPARDEPRRPGRAGEGRRLPGLGAGRRHLLGGGGSERPAEDASRALLGRLLGTVALALPVIVLAMVSAWQFRNWQWLSLVLATPVVTWGAWPFHLATWTNLRHRAATMTP